MTDDRYLGIYLNDHLAGATAGVEAFRRVRDTHAGKPAGAELARLTREVERERATLRAIIEDLGISVRTYKLLGALAGERLGRLKLNGHLLSRSPLSDLVELEALRIAVEGKAAGFRTLLLLAADDDRLDATRLTALIERAVAQGEVLESLRQD